MKLAPPSAGGTRAAASQAAGSRRLSTFNVPEEERLAYWLDVIGSLYVTLECETPPQQSIFGEVEFSRMGSLDVTHLRSNVNHIRRTPEKIRQETDDYCLVLIQREGRATLRQDGHVALMTPGDFALNDCMRPYELDFDGDHHDVYVLRLPRKQLTSYVGNLEDVCATTVSGRDTAGNLLLTMVETLNREGAILHPSSVLGVSDAITSVIGAGLRSLPEAQQRKSSNLSAYHVARIRAYVQQNLHDPELTIGAVAHAMKLSSDHVCRLFRNEPVPLSRLIWQQRLAACRRDLADPRLSERSVSEIAFSWGFNDATHFSRSFREMHGISPRDWRASQLESREA